MRTFIFAVATCLASSASAAEWTHFFDCGDGDQTRHYAYDKSSVRKQGDSLLVDITGDYSDVKASRAAKARLLIAMNCAGREYHQERRTEYNARGRVVARYRKPTPLMTISGKGLGQKLFDQVCV